jgi:hypothetical protein
MTHWKKLSNRDYMGAWSLEEGKDLTLTIRDVKREPVTGADGKKEECIVCYWKETGAKPMILNATNCKAIEKVLKSPHIEDWQGKQVTLYATNVNAFGENVEALRIRPVVVRSEKEVLLPTDPRWNKALEAVKAGTTTVQNIKAKFSISPEQESALSQAQPKPTAK